MIEFIGLMLASVIRIHEPINFTCSDYELMCDCVMAEAGGEDMQTQEAVATVILNRVYCEDKFPDTIEGVIMDPNQFSVRYHGNVTDQVRLSVLHALIIYGTFDQDISKSCYYFRAHHYHQKLGIPYRHIGRLYFSLAENATD